MKKRFWNIFFVSPTGLRRAFQSCMLFLFTVSFADSCLEPRWPMLVRQTAGMAKETWDGRNKELMDRDDALEIVGVRLWAATRNCSFFISSPYQMPVNWTAMLENEECPAYSFYNCKDRIHVSRSRVDSCLISIGFFVPACDTNEDAVVATHLYAFSICSEALESKWTEPVLFLP